MNKKFIIPFIILILLIIAGGVFWWWQGGKKIAKEVEEKPSVTETIMVPGKVIPPSGVNPESLTITGLATTTKIDKEGNFTTGRIYKEGVTILGAMPEGKEFGLMKVVIASEGKPETPVVIDSKSTAVGLVFTSFFLTTDLEKAREFLNVIEKDPEVEEFAKVIEQIFTEEDPMSNPLYEKALEEAIESVLSTLNP